MIEDRRGYWSNFVTGDHDYRTMLDTDEEAVQYIPQWPAAQSLFKLHREMGLTVEDAMEKVLRACVGQSR